MGVRGGKAKRKITQAEWMPLINVVWSTWEASQAVAFLHIPETQRHKEYKNK